MRDRAEELNVSRVTFDDASDLAVSYSSKNPPRPVRNSGR